MKATNAEIAGRFVSFRREHLKLTQPELADQIGVTKKTLSLIENGHRAPNPDILKMLSKKFSLNTEWLMSGKDSPLNVRKPNPDSIDNIQARISTMEAKILNFERSIKKMEENIQSILNIVQKS